MRKEKKGALFWAIGWVVAVYIGVSFFYWSFSPVERGKDGRAVLLAMLFFLTPFAAMFGMMFQDNRRW